MEKTKEKIVVILGPTATGKSNCGLELAERLKGEIISGDSMLVFRDMDIATAKPTEEELGRVPHHLVNILDPKESFNVVDFKKVAAKLITEITARGKLPIIVGGTGLYLKALLEDYDFAPTEAQSELRQELEMYALHRGNAALHGRLAKINPEAAAKLAVNDTRRIIRAIEVAQQGETVSQKKASTLAYDAHVFGLTFERPLLYERINKRVDLMVEAGIFAETKKFLELGISEEAQSMRSIGYRQIIQFYKGEYTREEAIDKLKQATRNFAKRQVTWYKQMPYIEWFQVENYPSYKDITEEMVRRLK